MNRISCGPTRPFEPRSMWMEAGRAPAVLRFQCTDAPGGFDLTATPSLALPPGAQAIRLVFAFDPAITHDDPPGRIRGRQRDALSPYRLRTRFRPDARAARRDTTRGNLAHRQPQAQRSRMDGRDPVESETPSATLEFRAAYLPQPPGLLDGARWETARRGWFNAFNLTSQWETRTRASAPRPASSATTS